MNKLILLVTLTLGSGIAYAAPLSYIYNITTNNMTVFAHDRTPGDACAAGKALKPEADMIEVSHENEAGIIVYSVCE